MTAPARVDAVLFVNLQFIMVESTPCIQIAPAQFAVLFVKLQSETEVGEKVSMAPPSVALLFVNVEFEIVWLIHFVAT